MQQLTSTIITLTLLTNRLRARAAALLHLPDAGQGLVEYGLILSLVAVVVIGIVTLLGQTVSGLWYQRIIDSLNDILS